MAPLARRMLWCLREAALGPRHLPRRLRKPRKYRGIYRDVCASCASTAAFAETFAQVAQVPPHLPRRLRRPRTYRGIYRDICASCAGSAAFTETFAQAALGLAVFTEAFAQVALGTAAFTETFAQAAQIPRHLPRRLRKPRWVSRGMLWYLYATVHDACTLLYTMLVHYCT